MKRKGRKQRVNISRSKKHHERFARPRTMLAPGLPRAMPGVANASTLILRMFHDVQPRF